MRAMSPPSSASAHREKSSNRRKGAVRGPAATYVRACARCNCKPSAELAADLSTNGALVVDLRLCTSEALTAICALLREAPNGLCQVLLRDGLLSLKNDAAYRARAVVHNRRAQTGALAVAQLRLLISALTTFLTVQGTRLSVLDLAGAQLGQEITTLLTPLAQTLRDCRAGQLRWLGLSGCRIGDSGLTLLLPCLAGKNNTLLRLEALTLASNCLTDVRLINVLLRARARLCFDCRAKPLQLLDLSGNPRLGDSIPVVRSARVPTNSRQRDGKGMLRPGVCKRPSGRRGTLIRALACAIAEGLPLRVLRLRRMGLDSDSLQPLLHLMQSETQRCLASDGALAGFSGFCLEELDVRENDLEPPLLAAITESLSLLRSIRDGLHEKTQHITPDMIQQGSHLISSQAESTCVERPSSPSLCSMRRARSAPPAPLAYIGRNSLVEEALVRPVISEGEEGLVKSTVECENQAAQSHESFLLQRAEDKRRLRNSLPKPRNREAADDECGLDSWAEAPLTIAGSLGALAAQSMVRQAVYSELNAGYPNDVTKLGCARTGEATFPSAANHSDGRVADQDLTYPLASASSSDDEADGNARDTRLEQLRDAVLGALSGSHGLTCVQPTLETAVQERLHGHFQRLENLAYVEMVPHKKPESTAWLGKRSSDRFADMRDSKLNELSQDSKKNSGQLGASQVQPGDFFNFKLDEMHREALADRQRDHTVPSRRAEGLSGLWG